MSNFAYLTRNIMEAFETLITQVHNERIKDEVRERHRREVTGENIYTLFWVWCNTQKDSAKLRQTPEVFGEWLKRENITLTFWQRKSIAENHFGYVFKWNENTNKWEKKQK